MAVLVWGAAGTKFFETGVDRGVFYPLSGSGQAWNGLVSVKERIVGGESKPFYFDGQKFNDVIANEDFSATIEAFSTPPGFAACEGIASIATGLYVTQQPRVKFGFSYRTQIGNDLLGVDYNGYKIHIVYGCTAEPVGRSYQTLDDKADLDSSAWTITTVPPDSPTTPVSYRPSAHLVIDVSQITAAKKTSIENLLYGTSTVNAALPTQQAIVNILVA